MPLSRTNCPLCESPAAAFMFRPVRSPGPVVRCRNCGLAYISPIEDGRAIITAALAEKDSAIRTSTDPGLLSNCWETAELLEKRAERPALHRNAMAVLRRLERHVPSPGRILDFGCGWGFFLATARERGWEPYGLEPLPGHAIHARAMTGGMVINDVLRDNTFPAAFFDVVTAFQVFEHLPDPVGDLLRLRRFLKPGGVIVIEVPNIATWSVTLLGKYHRHFTPDHLTFFSSHTLRAFLRKAGFQVRDVYHPTRWMTLYHLVAHWGCRMLGMRRTAGRPALRPWLHRVIVPLNMGDIICAIAQKQP